MDNKEYKNKFNKMKSCKKLRIKINNTKNKLQNLNIKFKDSIKSIRDKYNTHRVDIEKNIFNHKTEAKNNDENEYVIKKNILSKDFLQNSKLKLILKHHISTIKKNEKCKFFKDNNLDKNIILNKWKNMNNTKEFSHLSNLIDTKMTYFEDRMVNIMDKIKFLQKIQNSKSKNEKIVRKSSDTNTVKNQNEQIVRTRKTIKNSIFKSQNSLIVQKNQEIQESLENQALLKDKICIKNKSIWNLKDYILNINNNIDKLKNILEIKDNSKIFEAINLIKSENLSLINKNKQLSLNLEKYTSIERKDKIEIDNLKIKNEDLKNELDLYKQKIDLIKNEKNEILEKNLYDMKIDINNGTEKKIISKKLINISSYNSYNNFETEIKEKLNNLLNTSFNDFDSIFERIKENKDQKENIMLMLVKFFNYHKINIDSSKKEIIIDILKENFRLITNKFCKKDKINYESIYKMQEEINRTKNKNHELLKDNENLKYKLDNSKFDNVTLNKDLQVLRDQLEVYTSQYDWIKESSKISDETLKAHIRNIIIEFFKLLKSNQQVKVEYLNLITSILNFNKSQQNDFIDLFKNKGNKFIKIIFK